MFVIEFFHLFGLPLDQLFHLKLPMSILRRLCIVLFLALL